MSFKAKLTLKSATKTAWESTEGSAPVLGPGEIGVEEDTGQLKVGNGKKWGELTYVGTGLQLSEALKKFVSLTTAIATGFSIKGTPEEGQSIIVTKTTPPEAEFSFEKLRIEEPIGTGKVNELKHAGTVWLFKGSGGQTLEIDGSVAFTNKHAPIEVRQLGLGSVKFTGINGMEVKAVSGVTLFQTAGENCIATITFLGSKKCIVSGEIE